DEALIHEQYLLRAGADRRNRGIHAGAASPDDQHIGREIGHAGDLVPFARIATIGTAKSSPRQKGCAARTMPASIAGRAATGCAAISAAVRTVPRDSAATMSRGSATRHSRRSGS